MAGKPKTMSQIKQLLLLHQQGKGKKTIARLLGMSKTTVKVYLQKLQLLTSATKGTKPLTVADLVKLEDPVLEAKFHPGNPAYKDERYEIFKTNLKYYLKELKRTGVTKSLLWEEYRQQYPRVSNSVPRNLQNARMQCNKDRAPPSPIASDPERQSNIL